VYFLTSLNLRFIIYTLRKTIAQMESDPPSKGTILGSLDLDLSPG
jgi:hypothetical protein